MWLRPVNEMTELVSGMPAPQFGDEREDQSWFKVQAVLSVILVDVRCFRVPQVEDHCTILTELY
jgi:hypothetical protein